MLPSTPPPEELTPKEKAMLDTLLTIPRKKMPLSMFVKNFLPFVSSVPVPEDVTTAILEKMKRQTGQNHTVDDIIGNVLNEWMEYHQSVGAPYMEVEILDGNEVVYVVPPLLEDKEILQEGISERYIADVATQASNLSTVHVNEATRLIKESLLPLIVKGTASEKHLAMWNKIYEYHDLPLIKIENGKFVRVDASDVVETKGVTTQPAGQPSNVLLELDEYD